MKTRLAACEKGVEKENRAGWRGSEKDCFLVNLYSYLPHLPFRMEVMVEETRLTHFWWLEQ